MLQLSQSTMLPPRASGPPAAAPQAHPMRPPPAAMISRAHSQPAAHTPQAPAHANAHQHPLKQRLTSYKAAQLNERTGTSGDPPSLFAPPPGSMAERRQVGSDDGDRWVLGAGSHSPCWFGLLSSVGAAM